MRKKKSTKLWVTPKFRAQEKFKTRKRKLRRIKDIREKLEESIVIEAKERVKME